MAIKKIKMTIWTDTSKMELSGGPGGNGQDALDQLLIATGTREARETALNGLAACHKRVCDWEDEQAAKNG